jgi:hypothetical protein
MKAPNILLSFNSHKEKAMVEGGQQAKSITFAPFEVN